MAALPDFVCVLAAGYGEEFDPSVERTEMERGPAKERLLNSGVVDQLHVTLLFNSNADASAFEAWYFNEIKRIGWFTMTHPRTQQTITARFIGGNIGRLQTRNPMFTRLFRSTVVEYMR